MHSIRTKTILLSVIGIMLTMIVATIIGAFSIANLGHESSEQSTALLCETGKNSINYYFKSVEQSTNTISSLIDQSLDDVENVYSESEFHTHMEEARVIFSEAASHTNGVYTYYYRIDPSFSDVNNEKGFWYIAKDDGTFEEHEVSDLNDKSLECRWFYMTKEKGSPIWLEPYLTDNLDEYVVSYNVPVYQNEEFIGVVGIEIEYAFLGNVIKDIRIYKNGYAFIVDSETGNILYHPYIDILKIPEQDRPSVPEPLFNAMKEGEHHSVYVFEGVEKHSYWLKLSNEENIVVTVPSSEISEAWQKFIFQDIIIAVAIIAVFVTISIIFSQRITKSLRKLTKAAEEINNGNYDVKVEAKGNDEIATLTTTVNKLVEHLGEYIQDLNSLAYADALTSVRNKGAFNLVLKELQKDIDMPDSHAEFAIAILDCDNLKDINDAYGHDKGDVYLRNSCHLMCRVFNKSIVYRIGGDEFAIVLQGEDYKNRRKLEKYFLEKSKEICAFAKEPWEKIKVSIGIAEYDPHIDATSDEVVVHADHIMYEHKRARKERAKNRR